MSPKVSRTVQTAPALREFLPRTLLVAGALTLLPLAGAKAQGAPAAPAAPAPAAAPATTAPAPPAPPAPPAAALPQPPVTGGKSPDELVKDLFNLQASETDYNAAVVAARKGGVPKELIFEARLLHCIRTQDTDRILALLDEARALLPNVDPTTSQIFKKPNDAAGMLAGLNALEAEKEGDPATFQADIKDAFWKAPGLSQLFGAWANDFQEQQARAQVVLPLDVPLTTFSGGKTTLAQLGAGKKAILLAYWTGSSQASVESLPALITTAGKLGPQGIEVVGVNADSDPNITAAAHKQLGVTFDWVAEPADDTYIKLLTPDNVPFDALISTDGHILFAGSPDNPKLTAALTKLGVNN